MMIRVTDNTNLREYVPLPQDQVTVMNPNRSDLTNTKKMDAESVIPLTPPRSSIHMIGVGGSGMKSLALELARRGEKVTGSDFALTSQQAHELRRAGVLVYAGHHSNYVARGLKAVVYSPAVPTHNPERQKAEELGIPQYSYPEMLAQITADQKLMAISGTHGKTSTTGMTGWILNHTPHPASLIMGGEYQNNAYYRYQQKPDWAVIEACEYQHNFLHYHPHALAVLNIEPDHFDCFPSTEKLCEAFQQMVSQVHPEGVVIYPADDPQMGQILQDYTGHTESFSTRKAATWEARKLRHVQGGYEFQIYHQGSLFTETRLRVPGFHQVANALVACAMCHFQGVSPEAISHGLATYPGVNRRFHFRGHSRKVTLIDDYAHHPTAVRATLETAREEYPGQKIWCVFQPHQQQRLLNLMPEFAEAFELADEVIITPVFSARENDGEQSRELSQELAHRLHVKGVQARYTATLDLAIDVLELECQAGNVILTLGAGDIDRIADDFTGRICRHYAS
jgi:UDP-N-acetylmuramate--alanine ligase